MCQEILMIQRKKLKIPMTNKTILSYCLKYRKNEESKNSKVVKTKNGRRKIGTRICKVLF